MLILHRHSSHLLHLFIGGVEEALLLVERMYLLHLRVGQFKIEDADVFFDMVRVLRAWNC